MGTTNTDKKVPIEGPESLRPYFETGKNGNACLHGTELEVLMTSWNPATNSFELLTPGQHAVLVDHLKAHHNGTAEHQAHLSHSNEPGAHMLEIKNDKPLNINATHESVSDISRQIRVLARAMAESNPGVILLPFAVTAFSTNEATRLNLIRQPNDPRHYDNRPHIFMKAFGQHAPNEYSQYYPVTNTAVHITQSPQSQRQAFEMAKLQTALMPFLHVVFENRPPYQNASNERMAIHTGMAIRKAMLERGLVREFVYKAQNEQQLVDGIISDTLNSDMLTYINHNDDFTPTPKGTDIRPNNMGGLGPETISQFEIAMSGKWGPLKFKLADEKHGLLLELRDYDSAPDTVKNVTLLMNMLIGDEKRRAQLFDTLDKDYGIPVLRDPAKAKQVIKRNLDAALHRGDTDYLKEHFGKASRRMLDTPFGNKGRTMHDLLRDTLLPMMKDHYAEKPESAMLDTWEFIAATGLTNAQFWYDRLPSMQEQIRFVREITEDIERYHSAFASGKSFAQLDAEGRLVSKNEPIIAESVPNPVMRV